jgi:hypothetical protein
MSAAPDVLWEHARLILGALVDLDQAEAAEALAAVYRMVHLKRRRGGDLCAEQRAERNSGYRDYAMAEYGTTWLTPNQAKALSRKVKRHLTEARMIEGGSAQQEAARQIRAAGLGAVGDRQILRILREQKKL